MINAVRIVGGGLIGTSIGLRLKACGVRVEIQDSNSNAWKLASDLIKSETICNPQVIIVAVPIESVAQTVAEQLNLNPESIVCDLASVSLIFYLRLRSYQPIIGISSLCIQWLGGR